MRFLADGPSIPDELLIARDEGRVIFFCGAGVSRARAGLPSFFGLAQKVIAALGVISDSPAKRLMEVAQEIESRTGTSGLAYADRIFGLLEREFAVRDIQTEVAKVLRPSPAVDLSAHKIILDLAKGPEGKIRLVTTNFDRLFESCDSSLQSSSPPRLPDPQYEEDFEGIIHLHGRVDQNYKGVDGGGFVLSSSDFGSAYLADGWATRFIRTILDKYFVVFIGYAADDPPVQYLLEALNRSLGLRDGAYAFQSGSSNEAESKWRHKGVQPIVYNEGENHKALWETLSAWAVRAQNPEAWYEDIIARAQEGPEVLLQFERGQVAHVVSTFLGVKKFSTSSTPPPADWLCVFDKLIRYSKPGHVWDSNGKGLFFDPFDAYSLDSDPLPSKIDPDDFYAKREVPENAWDCFVATRLDRQNLRDEHFAGLRGHWATHVSRLPPRVAELGRWIGRVSNQPATVWWASGQSGIHPAIQFDIQFHLARSKEPCSPETRKAWHYIFEASESQDNALNRDWFNLKGSIRLDGWSHAAVRELALLHRPHLTAKRHWSRPKPPQNGEDLRFKDMVHLDVKYPDVIFDMEIPDDYLPTAVHEFRKNLELAVLLEMELGGDGLSMLVSIEPDPSLQGQSFGRAFGISAPLLFYVALYKQLIDKNLEAARREYLAWWVDNDVFASLRIWSAGNQRLYTGTAAGDLICSLNDRVFWSERRQRDLLLVLAKRWSDFSAELRTRLERRLLSGPPQWKDEEPALYAKRRAWSSLSRIHWLKHQDCNFAFDFDVESAKLRELVPEWQEQYAENAADSMEARGGLIQKDTSYDVLLAVPLSKILDKAEELKARDHVALVENDPYAGLAAKRPVRAFAALTNAVKRKKYPAWAWRTFLNSEGRQSDKPKLSALIAEYISRLPSNELPSIMHPTCDWFLQASGILLRRFPKQFERVWAKIVSVLKSDGETGKSSIIRGNKEPDWAMEALNSPIGKLAQTLMHDPEKDGLKPGTNFPLPWVTRVNELLSFEGDLRRQALVIFSYSLNWFFAIDPDWSEKHLISKLAEDGEDQNAVWAGLFWHAELPNSELYLRLKPRLLKLAQGKSISRKNYGEVLAGIVLAGWANENVATGERYVLNEEMREALINGDEDFRSHTLWQLKRWSEEEKGKTGRWATQLPMFLRDVWPRQRTAKSSRITAALCDLALSDMVRFSERVDLILPLVTTLDQQYTGLHQLENEIVEQHPEKVLKLLFAVLPEDPDMWPYGSGDLLERLETAAASLLKDRRLVELKRRWNSR